MIARVVCESYWLIWTHKLVSPVDFHIWCAFTILHSFWFAFFATFASLILFSLGVQDGFGLHGCNVFSWPKKCVWLMSFKMWEFYFLWSLVRKSSSHLQSILGILCPMKCRIRFSTYWNFHHVPFEILSKLSYDLMAWFSLIVVGLFVAMSLLLW